MARTQYLPAGLQSDFTMLISLVDLLQSIPQKGANSFGPLRESRPRTPKGVKAHQKKCVCDEKTGSVLSLPHGQNRNQSNWTCPTFCHVRIDILPFLMDRGSLSLANTHSPVEFFNERALIHLSVFDTASI